MVRISEKHGVNPAIPKCYYCNEDKNMIILAGRLPGDKEAPRGAVWDMEPCDQCKEWMRQGIICISVKDPKTPDEHINPYRTGNWSVVTEDFIRRVVEDIEMREGICKRRVAFIPDDAWEMLGLPTHKEQT